jgi:hypothetical protein
MTPINLSTGTATNTELGKHILTWMNQAGPVLHQSNWAAALNYRGTDVWEALIIPLFYGLLELGKDHNKPASNGSKTTNTNPWFQFIKERRLPNVVQTKLDHLSGNILSQRLGHSEVYLLPTQVSHLSHHLPLAKALRDRGLTAEFVASTGAMVRKIRLKGELCVYLPKVFPLDKSQSETSLQSAFECLRQQPHVSLPNFPLDIDTTEIIDRIRKRLLSGLPQVHRNHEWVVPFIKRIAGHGLVVIGNDLNIPGRVTAQLASKHGVSSIYLEHGLASGPVINGSRIVDSILAWGEAGKNQLVKYGGNPDKITVCGAPAMDDAPVQSREIDPRVRQRLQLSPDRPYVLVGFSAPGQLVSQAHHFQLIRTIAKASAALPHIDFVAKLHRRDKVSYYDTITKQIPGSRIQVVEYAKPGFPVRMLEWLQGAACLVTAASTVGPEAMLMKVPVITLLMDGSMEADFISSGATLHASTLTELEQNLNKVLSNHSELEGLRERAESFVNNHYFKIDGCSSARCVEAIGQILKAKHSNE